MNKGVLLATGDYVIFMNSGDRFYDSDVLQHIVINSGCKDDIIYGDHWTLNSNVSNGHHKAKEVEKIKYGMICSHQSMLFRRSILIHIFQKNLVFLS